MPIEVVPHHPLFFAEVRGVDLREPVAPATWRAIEAAFHRHAVLLFRGQAIDDDQQVAFSANFGPVMTATRYNHASTRRRGLRGEMADISNIDQDGRILAADDARRMFSLANQLWHTDNSFKHVQARCSLLSARELPPEGGETEFADMRAAWDALPEAKRREIEDLVAEHSIFHSRAKIGFTQFGEEDRNSLPPVRHVLVLPHPATGRKALYIASHASHIVGWPVEKGRALLEELLAFATQPRFVHSHRWRVGDLVVWDNRCTMHRARPYEELKYRRILHRTTVSDEVNTIEQMRARGAVLEESAAGVL